MVRREDVLHLVAEGRDYPEVGALLGVPPGLAYLVATGLPADGSDTVTGIQRQRPGTRLAHTQRLVNPRQVNPTGRAEVRDWMRRRAQADAQMQAAHS